MSEPVSRFDDRGYEKACDRAVAMCDGNLIGTIKALIMANEYLEAELEQLQSAFTVRHAPDVARRGRGAA